MRFTMLSLLMLASMLMLEINSENPIAQRRLSRRKRYVAFPEGATLSIAICMTAQMITRPTELFTEGLNWGISYDLPNNTAILEDFRTPGGFLGRGRYRRDLYQKMELIMDSMGYNGKDCIFKALCETGALFNQRGEGLIQEVLRIVFGYPTEPIIATEASDNHHYRDAHLFGQERQTNPDECAVRYSKCTFSLIDLALGYYTKNLPLTQF